MSTECYAMVRGSAIRVTGLDSRGEPGDPVQFAVSKAVAKVTINEIVEAAKSEILSNPEEARRLRFHRSAQTIRHTVDIDFLRVDPGVLSLVAGVELVYKDVPGFGEMPFGIAPFGGYATDNRSTIAKFGENSFGVVPFGGPEPSAQVVGFDSGTRLKAVGFALEVWSKLDQASAKPRGAGFGQTPFNTGGFGVAGDPARVALGFDSTGWDTAGWDDEGYENVCATRRRWGYTLFPYLRGGRVSGFRFENGLISFNLVGAQTRRASRWGVGPHDIDGTFERLVTPVSRNSSYRTFIINGAPPAQTDGIQEVSDVLDNGTASNPMPDPNAPLSVDGGGAYTSAWIIDGGRA